MTNKVTWSDLLVPPINLYNMPKMNTPYLDDKVYPTPIRKTQAEIIEEYVLKGGTKFDQDKPRMDLLDADALEGLAKVLTFGAKKYAAHNWRGGLSYSRLLAALLRHTFAILRGERNDPESGLPHIDHVGCCWMFASNMMKNRPDMDDLYSENNKGSAG